MFYFEDVFNRIIVFWKEKYFFSKRTGMYSTLEEDFLEIEWAVEKKYKKKYNDWEKVMVFIIYQVLVPNCTLAWNKHKRYFNIKDISVDLFEKQLVYNFYKLKKTEYKDQYKEFKDNYKGFKNPTLSNMTLGEYLKYHSLSFA